MRQVMRVRKNNENPIIFIPKKIKKKAMINNGLIIKLILKLIFIFLKAILLGR